MASQLTFTQLNQLYLAYFGRPVDFGGYVYYTSNNATVSDVAAAFAASAESQALYGTGTVASQVNAIYLNLFNRPAELAGLQYWTSLIVSGAISAPQAAIQIMAGAQGTDLACVNDKLAASSAFFNVIQADTTGADALGYSGSAAAASARAWLATVTSDATTIPSATATQTAVNNAVAAGTVVVPQTFSLTTGIDAAGVGAFASSSPSGNAVVYGVIDTGAGATDNTFTAADTISATGSNNVFNLFDVVGGTSLPAAQVSGIQTLNVRSGAGVGNTSTANFDVSGYTGLTALNVTASNGADLIKAAGTTAVSIIDTAGAVTVSGGSTQTVTTSGAVTLSGAKGAITVTDKAQGANNIGINGGTSVTLNVTEATTGANTITIGDTSKPTGAVTIVDNEGPSASGAFAGGQITVNGGTTVNVTVNATQPVATAAGANATTTESAVTVNGGTTTTAVTINQTATVAAANTVLAANETASGTFAALLAGQSLTIGGLTFVAGSAGTTAAQTAAAFANLTNGATSGAGTANGSYSGALTGWSSGAASGTNAVTFTSSTAAKNVTNITSTATGDATAISFTTTDGAAAAGTGGITAGNVTVSDANYAAGAGTSAGTITNVVASNYGTLTISDSNLSSLTAAGGGNITINAGSALSTAPTTTLALSLDGVSGNFSDSANVYKTINVTTANHDSTLSTLGATALTALTVSGSNALTISDTSGATHLATVTVSGAAGLTAAFAQTTLTDVNASASTGANVITIDPSHASYEGGSGGDTVTLAPSSTVSHSVTMGSGNDTVVMASGVTSLSAWVNGGAGTNTLDMVAADAATASGNAAFVTHLANFQVLGINTLSAASSIDVGLLGTASAAVVDAGAGATAGTTLSNFASGGTLTINDTSAGSITLSNAAWTATGATSDSLNIVLGKGETGFTVNSAGLDSVAIAANDTSSNAVTLVDTSTKTVTVTGAAALTLTATGDTHLTTVNAAANTGGLTMVSTGTATTVTGSATAANSIAAASGTGAVTISGGSGNDTLAANQGLDVLNGNGGFDTFVVQGAGASAGIHTTINGFAHGDMLVLADLGTETFAATAITLAAGADLTQYLNAAVGTAVDTTNAAITWFQYGGNTYVVEGLGDHSATGSNGAFIGGTDIVVTLTGTVDLSHAQFSNTVASAAPHLLA